MAPAEHLDAVQDALSQRLAKVRIGDPRAEGVTMGALASARQLKDVREQIGKLHKQARIVSGNPDHVFPGHEKGAFMEPVLLRTDTPWTADAVHAVQALGPLSPIMPSQGLDDASAPATPPPVGPALPPQN